MQTKPPGHMTISAAAEILGCTNLDVKAMISAGRFRSISAPFRSNLKGIDTVKSYVNTQDIRDCLVKALVPDVQAVS